MKLIISWILWNVFRISTSECMWCYKLRLDKSFPVGLGGPCEKCSGQEEIKTTQAQ